MYISYFHDESSVSRVNLWKNQCSAYLYREWWGEKGSGWETDNFFPVYPPPPHTIHPPHQIATILEESVIICVYIDCSIKL